MSRNKVVIEQSVVRIITVGIQGPPGGSGESVTPATATQLGGIKINPATGDLGGTADAPTVPALGLKEDIANKGSAGGYAPLDSSAKVPGANLPDTITIDDTNLMHKTGNEVVVGQKQFDALALVSGGKIWLLGVLSTGELTTTLISGAADSGYSGVYGVTYS
jgi:hypothetical protein